MSRQPPEVLKVLVWPTPLLATVSETETFEDPKSLRRLIDAMWHTMYMHNGIGLAAVQVGVAKRIFVMDTGAGTSWVFINPKIIAVSGPKVLDEEGCLSVPGVYEKVKRHSQVVVEAEYEHGGVFTATLVELEARCFQHELEHLDGKFFLDSVPVAKREKIKKKLRGLK